MPAVADPETDVLGTVNNAAPGAVCAICRLGKAAADFAVNARKSGFTYVQIADAMSEGASRPISQQKVWHHINHGERQS